MSGFASTFSLAGHGIATADIRRNLSPAHLYEEALSARDGELTSLGAIASRSGGKTGRSPKDKRIVEEPATRGDIWWGPVNIKLSPRGFDAVHRRAVDFLAAQPRLYVVDGYAGWDPNYRLKIRVICVRPYHALFMHNMLVRPTAAELATFGEPDFTIYNAGAHPADPHGEGMTSATSVALNFATRKLVILGTEYAGEMKKGVFTIMNYLMPQRGVFPMHCSANEGPRGDTTLFFGLSGTGKTTLSADHGRRLIGDDEHVWTDAGIFNIEGGCYAKCVNLSAEREPQIYAAIRFGAILENTVQNPFTREVDFRDKTLTENTRVSYPIEFIPNAKIPCVGGHPTNIVFLACDAFGVLPPVSRLTPEQAMYHFISGYTAKVAGTEMGILEPEATFSACFGQAFLVWHPAKYAELLAAQMRAHRAQAWLVNTGWSGGGYGVGQRISLAHTRAILDAIHSGELAQIPGAVDPVFGVDVPSRCPNVPSEILLPRQTWPCGEAYDRAAGNLAGLFHANFAQYAVGAGPEITAAGPRG